MLGLRFCARAFSSCGKRGPLFIAVRGPLTVAASLVAEHKLQTRRLSSCGSQALLLRSMWDLPRPGFEPVSPALAGRFSTTVPPGKPCNILLKIGEVCPLLLFVLFYFLPMHNWCWTRAPCIPNQHPHSTPLSPSVHTHTHEHPLQGPASSSLSQQKPI